MCATFFCKLWRMLEYCRPNRKVCKKVIGDTCGLFIHSLVTVCFHYCSSPLYSIPDFTLLRLQTINTASRILRMSPNFLTMITFSRNSIEQCNYIQSQYTCTTPREFEKK